MTNHNVDEQEIAKFDALASKWWDPDGELKTLHDINAIRLRFIQRAVTLADKQIIDVGCGGGILSEALAQAGAAQVTGIDCSQEAIACAQQHHRQQAPKLPLDYQVITTEVMAQQQPAAYDIVTCLEMLEHVPDPQAIITACAQLAKPNGHLFFSTINRTPKAYLHAVLGAEYLLGILPKGTHAYQKFILPAELDEWMRNAGLELITLSGIEYNPFNRQANLSANVAVNYIVHAQRND